MPLTSNPYLVHQLPWGGDLGEIAHFIMNQALGCAGNNHMIIPSY